MQLIDTKENHRQAGIYWIVNTKTGKYYIGSSINIYSRLKRHLKDLKNKTHHSTYLQRSFDVHGHACFMAGILEVVDANTQDFKSTLKNREQYWLDTTKCYTSEVGYNMGSKAVGVDHTAEVRLKISVANSGKKQSEDTIRKRVNKITGRKRSLETRVVMSEKAKGRIMKPEDSLKSVETRKANGNMTTEATKKHAKVRAELLRGITDTQLVQLIQDYLSGMRIKDYIKKVSVDYRTFISIFGSATRPIRPVYQHILNEIGYDGSLGYGVQTLQSYKDAGKLKLQ